MRIPFLLFLTFISGIQAFTQNSKKKNNLDLYPVGYRNIIATDSGRRYKPGTDQADKFYFRPVEIDIWYPATSQKTNSPIKYAEFINLLEQRSNRFQDDTVYKNMSAELIQYLNANLKIRDTGMLAHLKTFSFLNAEAVGGRFPLILYLTAFNGMSYENITLFEWLAAHGYVVACITSVGRYPGNMSTRPEDLMEQVRDGSFALSLLKPMRNIDSANIGITGYSWGGLAALVMAMNIQEIKAILSLDGSEMHYYGESREEDDEFDELRTSSFFQINSVNIPYAYLESGFKQNDREVDSVFDILPSLNTQKLYTRFPKATHEDFSCLPSLATMYTQNKNQDLYQVFNQFSLSFFNCYLKNQPQSLSQELTDIYLHHGGDSLYPIVNNSIKIKNIIKGKVVDFLNKDALSYVNIGIPDKNIGTVSRWDGRFLISTGEETEGDSLKFSMIGYISQTYSLSDLSKQSQPLVIYLKESISELKEVVVTGKTSPVRTLGNRTTSNFVSIGLPLKFLGSEIGIKINLGKKPVQLKRFNFNISDNRLDTAVFRMNIYQFSKGMPTRNILRKNIFIPVGKQTGRYTVNLSEYKLQMKGDILISVEWIEGSYSGGGNGIVFLSAGFLNSATWHRLTSQGKWKKATGMGVGFNLDVQ